MSAAIGFRTTAVLLAVTVQSSGGVTGGAFPTRVATGTPGTWRRVKVWHNNAGAVIGLAYSEHALSRIVAGVSVDAVGLPATPFSLDLVVPPDQALFALVAAGPALVLFANIYDEIIGAFPQEP